MQDLAFVSVIVILIATIVVGFWAAYHIAWEVWDRYIPRPPHKFTEAELEFQREARRGWDAVIGIGEQMDKR